MAKQVRLSERQAVAMMTIYHGGLDWQERPPGIALATLDVLRGHGFIEMGTKTCKRVYKILPEGEDWANKFMKKVVKSESAMPGNSDNQTLNERVSSRLRTLRLIAGMSQDLLSRRARLSRATVNSIEAHTSRPSLRHLELLGKALGVEPWLLLAPDNHWQEFMKEKV